MNKLRYYAMRSASRKYWREKGYTTAPEKSYFQYSTKERAQIRENFKPNSVMNKWAISPSSKVGFEPNREAHTSMKDYGHKLF